MEQEIFEIPFEFKRQNYKAEVRTVIPNGPYKGYHHI